MVDYLPYCSFRIICPFPRQGRKISLDAVLFQYDFIFLHTFLFPLMSIAIIMCKISENMKKQGSLIHCPVFYLFLNCKSKLPDIVNFSFSFTFVSEAAFFPLSKLYLLFSLIIRTNPLKPVIYFSLRLRNI